MDELGAELVDRILPDVPYRQWVLSLPWDLRALCARRPEVLTAVARGLWHALKDELRLYAGEPEGEPGAITFVQRFGGSLNLNVHLHLVVPDGVFVTTGDGGVRFMPIETPSTEMLERVVTGARKRILRWLGRKGYLDAREPARQGDEEPDGLEACQRTALHYGTLVGLAASAAESDPTEPRLSPKPTHRHHARTQDGFDLVPRVVIAPPRFPLVRFHGVFAAAHTWRPRIVPKPPVPRPAPCKERRPDPEPSSTNTEPLPPTPPLVTLPTAEPTTDLRSPFLLSDPHMRRLLDGLLLMTGPRADWATLLRRSHDLDVLDCPRCHGRLRLRAVLRDKRQARRFLHFLRHPLPRARAPDQRCDPAA